MKKSETRKFGSVLGLVISLAIGFGLYFALKAVEGTNAIFNYTNIIDGITHSVPKQVAWFFMNFTEAQFYASLFAGIGLIVGGFVAWQLAKNNAKCKGFEICYGSASLFPWVFASQAISLCLAIFVFRYINLFSSPSVTWIATFISVVGAPPAVMLLYGPSVPALITSSVLGGLLCPPVATWISAYIVSPWKLPGVVANVTTMAITGLVICMICKALPWVTAQPVQSYHHDADEAENVYTATWFIRRVLAEFSEAPFYGNEVASLFLLIGLIVGEIVCGKHGAYGSGQIPAILLSQFIGAAVGIFLYSSKFENGGWYATYVPVVSVGPACVLMFGANIPVAAFAGALGGILGGPVAEYFAGKLPDGVHVTVANVTSMAICTTIVATIMKVLPF